ncbi:MAG TPA: sigma-70 family RNA polymerase sigma factor [Kofleriaceae bacterium]|nr:sigma-70 family RNA polymerase sigma factor [Kofleriaceae bacterium]
MNRADLEQLYRDHGPAVLRRARQILQNEAEALDALQEIFLSLARQSAFEPGRGTTAWFYIRTTNFCLNSLRDSRNRARLRDAIARPERSVPARSEDVVLARDVLARLPPELASVAVYYYCDEMTHDEIAALLGCSRRHVGHLVERLHRQLEVTACG